VDQIEKSDLSELAKNISYYIAQANYSLQIPSTTKLNAEYEPKRRIDKLLKPVIKKNIVFNMTLEEMAKVYTLEYLGFMRGRFFPPKHLGWSKDYLDSSPIHTKTWHKKIIKPRAFRYKRYWVALIEYNGIPAYQALGLHIPKPIPKVI
jgi:hypothetical protein